MSQYSDSTIHDDKNTSWQKSINLIDEGSVVLDVGCSSGNFGKLLADKKNCIVDGIEVNKDDARKAKEKLRNVYVLNVESDDLMGIDKKYDVLFCGDVIEHLARPVEALGKLKNLLQKDGKLVYSIPNITHMSVRLMLLKGDIEYGKTGLLDETHLHFYNSSEVQRVLSSAGFRIEKFDYTEKDLPYEYVEKELDHLGLEASENFKEVLQSLDAAAYQFIGKATIDENVKNQVQELPDQSPIDKTQEFLNHYIKKVKELEQHIRNVEADRERILEENKKLKNKEN